LNLSPTEKPQAEVAGYFMQQQDVNPAGGELTICQAIDLGKCGEIGIAVTGAIFPGAGELAPARNGR
jgi:hypothetical protein